MSIEHPVCDPNLSSRSFSVATAVAAPVSAIQGPQLGVILGSSLGAVALLALLALILVLLLRRRFKKIAVYKDVEVKQVLGEGKFGKVYLGIWQNGTKVALKKHKGEESKEFDAEAAVLRYFFALFFSSIQ